MTFKLVAVSLPEGGLDFTTTSDNLLAAIRSALTDGEILLVTVSLVSLSLSLSFFPLRPLFVKLHQSNTIQHFH